MTHAKPVSSERPIGLYEYRDHHVYLCAMRMLDGQILGSQRQEQVAREEKLLKDVRNQPFFIHTCLVRRPDAQSGSVSTST
jgi:hypothetical protein